MSNNPYECLDNEKDSPTDGDHFFRSKERTSLKIRIRRVFSSGSLKSPKSPGLSPSDVDKTDHQKSLSVKTRYSWQHLHCDDACLNSPRGSFSSEIPIYSLTGSVQENESTVDADNEMKYSPQQQQKERKSESEVASINATPSRPSRSRDSSGRCTNRLTSDALISLGMFAWMRVFRMAALLPQVGC